MANVRYQITESAFYRQTEKRKTFNYERLNRISQPCDTLQIAYNIVNDWLNELIFEMSLDPNYVFKNIEQQSDKQLAVIFEYMDNNNKKCELKVLFRIKLNRI